MSWDLLNIVDADRTARERQLNSGRTGFKEEANFGDSLRRGLATILGEGDDFKEENLLESAQAQARDRIKLGTEESRAKALQVSGGLDGVDAQSLRIKPGESESAHNARIAGITSAGTTALTLQAQTPELSFAGIAPTQQAVLAAASGQKAALKERASNEYGGKNYMAQMAEQQRLDRLSRERQARLDTLENRRENRRSENKRYELEIMRMQQSDKDKRQDRRDRMIMTLMSGLNNLGQAFTV